MQRRKLLLSLMVGTFGLFAYLPTGASAADLDCADFSSQAEAQENLLPGDPYGLDGDSDDIACEDLPCPCATGSGTGGGDPEVQPLPPPPPPKLDKAAARAAAERKARKFTRRHANLDSVALQRCGRHSRDKILCWFVASGRSRSQQTTCRFRVVVQGEGGQASARVRGVSCHSRALAVLSLAMAKAAMGAATRKITETRVVIYALNRLGPRAFTGLAEWTQVGPTGTEELCSVELTAEQPPARSIRVKAHNLDCQEV